MNSVRLGPHAPYRGSWPRIRNACATAETLKNGRLECRVNFSASWMSSLNLNWTSWRMASTSACCRLASLVDMRPSPRGSLDARETRPLNFPHCFCDSVESEHGALCCDLRDPRGTGWNADDA